MWILGVVTLVVLLAAVQHLRGRGSPPPQDALPSDPGRLRPGQFVIVLAPGPLRGLAEVTTSSAEHVELRFPGRGSLRIAQTALPGATRPVLTRAEAEARLSELRQPGVPDARHPTEQFITNIKIVSKGSDEELGRRLRELSASPWKPEFGDLKMLAMFEETIFPELAHVLGVPPGPLASEVRAHHAIAHATQPAPPSPAWPGEGDTATVPPIDGLEAIGTLRLGHAVVLGERIDRHADPDSGLATAQVEPGVWHAYLASTPEPELEPTADEDEPPHHQWLVLLHADSHRDWPVEAAPIGQARRWESGRGLQLDVVAHDALAIPTVMDSVRYLGGTNAYWGQAITVAVDQLPMTMVVSAARHASGSAYALIVPLTPETPPVPPRPR